MDLLEKYPINTVFEDIKKEFPDEKTYKHLGKVLLYYSLYVDDENELFSLFPINVSIPFEITDWSLITANIKQSMISQYCSFIDECEKFTDSERDWIMKHIVNISNKVFKKPKDVLSLLEENGIKESKAIIFLASIIYPTLSITKNKEKESISIPINNLSLNEYKKAVFYFLLNI